MHYDHTDHVSGVDRPGRSLQAEASERLDLCPHCEGSFVYPLDWAEETSEQWRVTLRCPDCERVDTGVFALPAVERLDHELDRATEELLADLKRITHANMSDEVDFFIRALNADVIVPSDF